LGIFEMGGRNLAHKLAVKNRRVKAKGEDERMGSAKKHAGGKTKERKKNTGK